MLRIAINGYGRIGRNILRALVERDAELASHIEVVAINDLGDSAINAHLTQYDSVHGRFPVTVATDGDDLIVGKQRIRVFSERDPAQLPWRALNIDVVCECTGVFTSRDAAARHLSAGARKVLVSAPTADADATVVYGINDHILSGEERVVSNASCTTNCLAPLVKPLHEAIGITKGYVTTIHAYTNDQQLSDVYHSDLYRARAATQSMIPTKTGAAAAIDLVLPELKGRLDGMAVRIPTINVSLVDLSFIAERDSTAEEVNEIMTAAAQGPLAKVLDVNTAPLVSIDFNHCAASCVFDANHSKVNGKLVKVMAWYDNEWGFANRMLDNCLALFVRAELLKSA
ncbi:type I glyceraldehyde-3-phosphate dehydrogenase [Congregibacter sp.]|uniref:type I glyceraldehyde-3-phosphate dehydrogenase n=1 Tax=Congregibacter sp. TaxID=2744308 RepID=UPI003F6D9DEC